MHMHGHSCSFPGHRNATLTIGRASVLLAIVASLSFLASCARKTTDELVIYAYDSFVSEWGPGPKVMPKFEKATGIKATLLSRGDSGQVLAAAIDEKGKPNADLIIGIDQYLLPQAAKAGVLSPYKPSGIDSIAPELVFDPEYRVIPFDYGHFAIIWDTESSLRPPASLADLTLPEYRGALILMDPRSSTVGLGFLAWTVSAFGNDWSAYWKSLKPSILTVASGWDSGYGLFTKGEAPMVLSYSTSPAYHVYAEDSQRYVALEFQDGHILQIEGAGILKGARNRKNAEKFIDFMLSEAFQSEIPLTNWMYPVASGLVLPDCYDAAAKPRSAAAPDPDLFSDARAAWADVASE